MIPPQEDLDQYLLALYSRLQQVLPAAITPIESDIFDNCLINTLQTVYPAMKL